MRRAEASPARIYRQLLALYPPEFRTRYCDLAVTAASERARVTSEHEAPPGYHAR